MNVACYLSSLFIIIFFVCLDSYFSYNYVYAYTCTHCTQCLQHASYYLLFSHMNIIIFHSFRSLYVHALTIFLFSLYLLYFDYCHMDATCYLSSLLHYFFFVWNSHFRTLIYVRALHVMFHNLLVINYLFSIHMCAVPHPGTRPPVLWTGKMQVWTGIPVQQLVVDW